MPELPPVAPGEIIASDHINDIALRSVQRYATIADLTAENPTPQEGELAYVADRNILAQFTSGDWGGVFAAGFGTEAFPGLSFFNDRSTGMYRDGGRAAFTGGGVDQFRSGNASTPGIIVQNGTLANPGVRFDGDETSGLFLPAIDQVTISAGGTEAFRVRGGATQRTYMPLVPGDETASAANMFVATSDGRTFISTSARKYKSNIKPAPQLADLTLEPVTFHHDGDDKDYIGFIADDMPIEEAIVRDNDGEVENYDLRAVVAILTAKVTDLTARLETLEA